MNCPNTDSGRLIVICGIDGSGKTLQSKRLHARMEGEGKTSQYVEFPRYDEGFFGELIARYLRGELAGDADSVNPYMASLPFACDRWEFSSTLREWLDQGEIVVCNRYVSANMAHQGGKIKSKPEREQFYNWVERLEYDIFGIPRPHTHLWLDIRPEHAMQLIGKKGSRDYLKDAKDIHENRRHLIRAREAYAELAGRQPGWVRIDCSSENGPKPAEEITQEVWNITTNTQIIKGVKP